jgi:hypothetical protein
LEGHAERAAAAVRQRVACCVIGEGSRRAAGRDRIQPVGRRGIGVSRGDAVVVFRQPVSFGVVGPGYRPTIASGITAPPPALPLIMQLASIHRN